MAAFANALPIRITLSRRSVWSSSSWVRRAATLPCRTRWRKRMRLSAIMAVSAIEKKAERISSTTSAEIWAQSGRRSTASFSVDGSGGRQTGIGCVRWHRTRARAGRKALVGVRGFEPPTPASRTQYSTRLSYTPCHDAPQTDAPLDRCGFWDAWFLFLIAMPQRSRRMANETKSSRRSRNTDGARVCAASVAASDSSWARRRAYSIEP